MGKDLSIIIINYNTFDLTCKCIQSVIDHTYDLDYEILLIDNASHEIDPQEFKKVFPNIRLMVNQENVGFGKANDQGMELAEGDFFLLLNSDTMVTPHALDKCVSFFRSLEDPKIGILGCKVLNVDGSPQHSWYHSNNDHSLKGTFLKALNSNLILSRLMSSTAQEPKAFQHEMDNEYFFVGGLYGVFMMLKREVYEKVGGFDPDFFMYSEDIEFFRNRIRGQYKTVVFPGTEVKHFKGGSGGQSYLMKKQKMLSYFLYWYKVGYLNYMVFSIISLLSLILEVLSFPLYWRNEWVRERVRVKVSMVPYILFIIPKRKNEYGARKNDLRVRGLN